MFQVWVLLEIWVNWWPLLGNQWFCGDGGGQHLHQFLSLPLENSEMLVVIPTDGQYFHVTPCFHIFQTSSSVVLFHASLGCHHFQVLEGSNAVQSLWIQVALWECLISYQVSIWRATGCWIFHSSSSEMLFSYFVLMIYRTLLFMKIWKFSG